MVIIIPAGSFVEPGTRVGLLLLHSWFCFVFAPFVTAGGWGLSERLFPHDDAKVGGSDHADRRKRLAPAAQRALQGYEYRGRAQ